MAQDMQERLRQLEGKVAMLTVINGALQNENETLRHDQSSAGRTPSATDAELHELQEEFTRRIATADRTIASLKEKNESLRAAVEAASKGGNANEARLQDQQTYIATLQAEGETMSRKNNELEGTLRKLRSQGRKLESERDRLAGRLASLEASLAGEQERAMHATQAAAMQIELMEEEMRAAKQEAASQVAAARKEAAAAQEEARREAQRHGASTMATAIEREAALSANLADLRAEYEEASSSFFTREEGLRQEVSRLEDRVRALEDEKTELAASSSDHTRPLMRQIESMAASAAAQQAAHAEAEQQLIERLKTVEAALSEERESEQSLKGKLSQTERALAAARAGLESAAAQTSELTEELGAERKRAGALTNDVKRAEDRLNASKRREDAARQRAEADVQLLQQRLKAAESKVSLLETDRMNWQERYQESLRRSTPASPAHSMPVSRAATHGAPETSPFHRHPGVPDRPQSTAVAADEEAEPTDDLDKLIRAASGGGAHARQHPTANGHAPEASQLQYLERRIKAAEADAEGARMELLRACQQLEAAAADVTRCKGLEQRLQELEKRYEMALELLGERNEHVDKLEDDIREMKDIFHSQLSLMADQLSLAKGAEQLKPLVSDQPSHAM